MEARQENPQPSIFEYDDYRSYLRDFYSFMKATRPQFSYRYFSQRAGFQSPNFLKLVIDGQRNLSNESIERFTQAMKLSSEEAAFFESLVQFNQASDSEERARCAQNLMRSKTLRKFYPLRLASYDYYSRWYYIPIRELVKLPDFREEPEWIASQFDPPLKTQDASRAIVALEELGLLQRDAAGRLRQTHESLTTDDEVVSSQIANYHREMMKHASDSIALIERSKREISAACIPVSETSMKKIKARIQEFRDEILAIAAEDTDCDSVYQLNMQLFPLTKTSPGESK
jgi:uncharacterized protein (TIGR02147 family)